MMADVALAGFLSPALAPGLASGAGVGMAETAWPLVSPLLAFPVQFPSLYLWRLFLLEQIPDYEHLFSFLLPVV